MKSVLDWYDDLLCGLPVPERWHPPSLATGVLKQLALVDGPVRVVAFGSGAGVCLEALGGDFQGLEARLEWFAVETARPPGIQASRTPALAGMTLRDGPIDSSPDQWAAGAHLVISAGALPGLADTLGFIEQLYAALQPGGVALLHVDDWVSADDGTGRWLRFSGADTLATLVAQQQQLGLAINLDAHHRTGRSVWVLRFQRRADLPLAFGLTLVGGGPDAGERVSLYRR